MESKTISIVNSKIELVHLEDGLMKIHCPDEAHIDIEDIKAYVDFMAEKYGDKKFYNIVTFGLYVHITPEARRYAATPESNRFTLADAFVLKSLSLRILGNFYLKMDKPSVPTKLFKDEEEARVWIDSLRSF